MVIHIRNLVGGIPLSTRTALDNVSSKESPPPFSLKETLAITNQVAGLPGH